MFDHIGIGVSDLKGSKAFFLQALSPLGVGVIMDFLMPPDLGGRKSLPFGSALQKVSRYPFTSRLRQKLEAK